jgi:hypothetical protein
MDNVLSTIQVNYAKKQASCELHAETVKNRGWKPTSKASSNNEPYDFHEKKEGRPAWCSRSDATEKNGPAQASWSKS